MPRRRSSGRSSRKRSTVKSASNKTARSQASKASSPKFKGIGADKVNQSMPKSGF